MYGMLRSNNQRLLKLSEITIMHLEGELEGPTDCSAVVAILDESKTNQRGKIQYASFIRNRDLFVCPISLLSLYLFCR